MIRQCFLIAMAAASLLPAQPPAAKPRFEVVSIKESKDSGIPVWTPQRFGNRAILRRVRLDVMINYAWRLDNSYQVAFPDNMPREWWDIEAESDGIPDEDTLRLMYRSMLEDRFHVKTHYEDRQIPDYTLRVSKAGKLRTPGGDFKPKIDGVYFPPRPGTMGMPSGDDGRHLIGGSASLDQLADALSKALRAPVRNATGITGAFDIDVLIEGDPRDATADAALIGAVQRELGLKLERTRAKAKVLVVDHVEKSTPN